jgi:hypothetical protein
MRPKRGPSACCVVGDWRQIFAMRAVPVDHKPLFGLLRVIICPVQYTPKCRV